MIGKFFSFLGSIVSGVGLLIGSVIVFIFYALFGYFFLWLMSFFAIMMISWEWITNESVQYLIITVFDDYKHITEIVFSLGFGILGVIGILNKRNSEY